MEVRVNNMTKLGFKPTDITKAENFANSTSNWVKKHGMDANKPIASLRKEKLLVQSVVEDDIELER